jgi:hypothetical protein
MTDKIIGGRGLAVTNCRFHSVAFDAEVRTAAIKIQSGSVAFNPIITDNQMDTGQQHFLLADGDVYGGTISNNVIGFCTFESLYFNGVVENVNINNNSMLNYNHR